MLGLVVGPDSGHEVELLAGHSNMGFFPWSEGVVSSKSLGVASDRGKIWNEGVIRVSSGKARTSGVVVSAANLVIGKPQKRANRSGK